MTGYESHLLELAYDAVISRGGSLTMGPSGASIVVVASKGSEEIGVYTRDTLADALIPLLENMGVEVPERPSTSVFFAGLPVHEVRAAKNLRDLYAREPLTVRALLEGEPS